MRRTMLGVTLGLALTAVPPALADTPEGPLVSTDWLEQNLDRDDLRIVEVSVEPGVFERGHVPGAQNVRWHTDLVETTVRDIAGPEKFQELVRALGIDEDTTVVLYGDNNNWFAAWGAWLFSYYGLGDQVKLLDGGRKKWEAEGRPLSSRPETVAASELTLGAPNRELRALLPDVLAAVAGDSDAVILDIRSPDEFSGKIVAPEGVPELAIRAGHMPGAVNVPWGKAVNEDGTFKSVDELKALYASVGIDGSQPIITTCRIGERSSHSWFLLTNLLGYEAANYDGSWTEYGNLVGVPIENPAGTIWAAR